MSAPVPPDDGTVDRRSSTVVREEGVAPVTAPMGIPVVEAPATAPAHAQADHVTVDYGAERRATLHKASQFISFIFGLAITLIFIRVLLLLIAANPNNAFASFIYGITAPLIAPFNGLTGSPSFDEATLEISSIVAAIIYALVAWALIKLVWLLFYRPTTTDASTTIYHRH